MIDSEVLENYYKEDLDERIIQCLSQKCRIDAAQAMDIYYHSNLSDKIYQGRYGIQYLDEKVLVEILMKTEPELFK